MATTRNDAAASEPTPLAVAEQAAPTPPEPTDKPTARRAARLARPTAGAAELPRTAGRTRAENRPTAEEKEEKAKLYTVRPGDNLTKLAHEQGVSIAELKAWNKLDAETVVVGQQLRLVAPADATALSTTAPATRRAKPETAHLKLEMHIVQPGDTLFNISQRFAVSVDELRRLNHLPANAVVKVGQKLLLHG